MKELKRMLLSAALLGGVLTVSATGEYVYRSYADCYEPAPNQTNPGETLSFRYKWYGAGQIDVTYGDNLPLDVLTCAKAATDIVEQCIYTPSPVRVNIIFDAVAYPDIEGMDYRQLTDTRVRFIHETAEDLCYPTSIYRQHHELADDEGYDGTIVINSDIDWDFGFHGRRLTGVNLTTSILRAYMKILGLSSSIEKSAEGPVMRLPALTTYDNLIRLSAASEEDTAPRTLKSFNLKQDEASSELAGYLSMAPVLHLGADKTIALATDEIPWDHDCFGAFEGECLTSHFGNYRHRLLSIDEETMLAIDAVGWAPDIAGNKIGWTSDDWSYRIVNKGCDGKHGNLTSPEFTIETSEPFTVTESSLTMNFRLADGSGFTANAPVTTYPCVFEIPSAEEQQKYEINVNGDIYAYIEGTVKGTDGTGMEKTLPVRYRASMRKAPIVEKAWVEEIVPYGELPWGTSTDMAKIGVIYRGADGGEVTVLSGGDQQFYHTYFAGPYIDYTEVLIDSDRYPVDIRIEAANTLGRDTYVLHLESSAAAGVEHIVTGKAAHTSLSVYSTEGIFLGRYADESGIGNLPKGIYIIVMETDGKPAETRKIVI